MSRTDILEGLADSARIWVYAADRSLGIDERGRVLETLDTFCAAWRSHGRRVHSKAAVVEDRFAVIGGEIPEGDISGCGIDASVHALSEVAGAEGFSWLPSLWVHYRNGAGEIVSVPRSKFRELVRSGGISADTPVFDLSLSTVGELRDGKFEKPSGLSWHSTVFRIAEPSR